MSEEIQEHKHYVQMSPYLKILSDILGGTRKMRTLAKSRCDITRTNDFSNDDLNFDYLPQRPQEHNDWFINRVKKSTMNQYVGNTIQTYSGLVFRKPIKKQVENETLLHVLDNITEDNQDIEKFCLDLFESALRDGKAHIFVDFPTPSQDIKTLKDQEQINLMPVFRLIEAKDLINWNFVTVNGRKQLEMITIKEYTFDKDDKDIILFRKIFSTGEWFVYDETENLLESGMSDIKQIPLFTVYASKKLDDFFCYPTFIDMAYNQISVYQKDSMIDDSIEVMCFPPLVIASDMAEQLNKSGISWGAHRSIFLEQGAKADFVEISGEGIKCARERRAEIVQNIIQDGASFLVSGTQKTATARILDGQSNDSRIMKAIRSLENAVNNAFELVKQIMNIEEDTSIEINKDIQNILNNSENARVLLEYVQDGILSRRSSLDMLKQYELISDDLDYDTEQERIQEENDNQVFGVVNEQ